MANQYQDALLKSIDTIVDNKLKKSKMSYYINGCVIDIDNGTYTVANSPHICTEEEKRNYNNCASCPYNGDVWSTMKDKQSKRIYDDSRTCNGYYNVVYDGLFARSGLLPTIGDPVQIMVKNGNFSTKFIDDVTQGKGTIAYGTKSDSNVSLMPSVDTTLSVGDITYNSANLSWKIDNKDLANRVLGGFALVWSYGEQLPCPNFAPTAHYDNYISGTTLNGLNELTTYTAWLITKDLYGKMQQSTNLNCVATFTTPAKPIEYDPTKYPTWYNTYRTQYVENEPTDEYDDLVLTGNFGNDNCILIENENFKKLINYYRFSGDAELDVWGIEFETTYNFGCLYKDHSKLPYLYIQKGNYSLPSSSASIDPNIEDYDQDTIDRCCDNYYSKVAYEDIVISSNYESIDTFDGSNYVYPAVMTSCQYPTDRDQNKETWEPNTRVINEPFASEYMVFLGVDINGTPNPYKCVVCLLKQSMETFNAVTKAEIQTEQWSLTYNVNKTFTIRSYRKEE